MFVKFCKQKTAQLLKIFVRRLPTFALRLSSALEDFTSVVGMGTGGALPV